MHVHTVWPVFQCQAVYNVLSFVVARPRSVLSLDARLRTVAHVPEVPSPLWAGHFLVP